DQFRLVAGCKGIEREFNAVLVADQEIPSTFHKQMVIIGRNLAEVAYNTNTLTDVLDDFNDKKASALCLHQAEKLLSSDLVDWAEEVQMPVLSIAPEVSWDQCYRLIYHFLLQQSGRVVESHNQLESFIDQVLKTTD